MKKLLLVALVLFAALPLTSHAAGAGSLSGYAWSSTIGWVSMNCSNDSSCGTSNYSVQVSSGGALSGYAWSPNVGWISFNSGDLTGCPTGSCTASINQSTGAVTGWARVVEGKDAVTQHLGGWGGWIHLAPDAGSAYGVKATGCNWGGYAWGGGGNLDNGVIGWLHFAGATYGVVGLAGSAACVGSGPTISDFHANPQTLASAPGTTQLVWTTQSATSCSIDQGVGSVTPGTNMTKSGVSVPVLPTTYTLTCTDGTTQTNAQTTVTSSGSAQTATCVLTTPPGSTSLPNTAKWTVTTSGFAGGTTFLYQWNDGLTPPNQHSDINTSTSDATTFTYSTTGRHGPLITITTSPATVTLNPTCPTAYFGVPPPPVITSFLASPNRVNQNTNTGVSLTVGATGVTTSCIIKDQNGVQVGATLTPDASGNVSTSVSTPKITTQMTYKVTCDASASQTAIVNVIPIIIPI